MTQPRHSDRDVQQFPAYLDAMVQRLENDTPPSGIKLLRGIELFDGMHKTLGRIDSQVARVSALRAGVLSVAYRVRFLIPGAMELPLNLTPRQAIARLQTILDHSPAVDLDGTLIEVATTLLTRLEEMTLATA